MSFFESIFKGRTAGEIFALFFLAVILCAVFFLIGRLTEKLRMSKKIKEERADAVKRSRSVITGQMSEQIAPFLKDFPCNPSDVRFIGKPVDFIGFSGLAEKGAVDEIVLIEVKTGNSSLNKNEKEIKNAVQEKRFRYIEYRIE